MAMHVDTRHLRSAALVGIRATMALITTVTQTQQHTTGRITQNQTDLFNFLGGTNRPRLLPWTGRSGTRAGAWWCLVYICNTSWCTNQTHPSRLLLGGRCLLAHLLLLTMLACPLHTPQHRLHPLLTRRYICVDFGHSLLMYSKSYTHTSRSLHQSHCCSPSQHPPSRASPTCRSSFFLRQPWLRAQAANAATLPPPLLARRAIDSSSLRL